MPRKSDINMGERDYTKQEFFDLLVEVQQFLHGETGSMMLHMSQRSGRLDGWAEMVISDFERHKKYYAMQLLFTVQNPTESYRSYLAGVVSSRRHIKPGASKEEDELLQCVVELLEDPCRFARKCGEYTAKDKSQKLLDILTYSVIPAYFRFFMCESVVDKLKMFVAELDKMGCQSLIKAFSRAVFVSPEFLRFVHMTMANELNDVLESVVDDCSQASEATGCLIKAKWEGAVEKICQNWADEKARPSIYVKIFLDKFDDEHKKNCVGENFLHPLRTFPERFMACEGHSFGPKKGVFMKDYCKMDRLHEAFIQLMEKPERSFGSRQKHTLPFFVLSECDQRILFGWNGGNPKDVQNVDMKCVFEKMKVSCIYRLDKLVVEDLQATFMPSGTGRTWEKISYYVRQLLKDAPSLHPDLKVGDKKCRKPEKLIKTHLVDPVCMLAKPRQDILYHKMCELFDVGGDFPNSLEDGRFRRSMEIIKDREFEHITSEEVAARDHNGMQRLFAPVIGNITELLELYMCDHVGKNVNQSTSDEQYVLMRFPKVFRDKITEWTTAFEKLWVTEFGTKGQQCTVPSYEVIYRYMCYKHNIDFARYVASNPDLQMYDMTVANILRNSGRMRSQQERATLIRIVEVLLKVPDIDGFVEEGTRILEENGTPLAKAAKIDDFLGRLYRMYETECEASETAIHDRGQEVLKVHTAFFEQLVNPLCLVSLYGFITDFVPEEGSFDSVKEALVRSIEICMNGRDGQKGMSWGVFSRLNRQAMTIQLCVRNQKSWCHIGSSLVGGLSTDVIDKLQSVTLLFDMHARRGDISNTCVLSVVRAELGSTFDRGDIIAVDGSDLLKNKKLKDVVKNFKGLIVFHDDGDKKPVEELGKRVEWVSIKNSNENGGDHRARDSFIEAIAALVREGSP